MHSEFTHGIKNLNSIPEKEKLVQLIIYEPGKQNKSNDPNILRFTHFTQKFKILMEKKIK